MPQEPKRRHSVQRKGKRRASIKLKPLQTTQCKNCSALVLPHTICQNCGFYNGRPVLAKSVAEKNEKSS